MRHHGLATNGSAAFRRSRSLHHRHGEDDIQILTNVHCGLIALLPVHLHGLLHDGIKAWINPWHLRRSGLEGPARHMPGKHLIQHDTHGIQIRTAIDRAAHDERLWGNIVGRAHGHAGSRQAMTSGLLNLGEAEVRDLHLPLLIDQNVRGFDVAMHDACGMGHRQRITHMRGNGQRMLRRQVLLLRNHA